MAELVQTLVDDVRVLSGLRANQLFTDTQIAVLLTDAQKELYDIFVIAVAQWFRDTLRFTLAGGTSDYTVALPTDFQVAQGVTLNPDSQTPTTVLQLGSFAERNSTGGATGNLGAYGGRRYNVAGDLLQILPPFNSAGDYELIYTRQAEALALPVVLSPLPYARTPTLVLLTDGTTTDGGGRWLVTNADMTARDLGANVTCTGTPYGPPTIVGGDYGAVTSIISGSTFFTASQPPNPDLFDTGATITITDLSVNAATGVWTFADLGAIAVGDTLVVSGSASNDGSYTVLTVGANYLTTATTGLVDETFDSTVSVTYQVAGTRPDVPQVLSPWVLFLKCHASVAILESRKMPMDEIGGKLEYQRHRAIAMSKARSEGVTQAPITKRWNGGWWGGFSGGGGF